MKWLLTPFFLIFSVAFAEAVTPTGEEWHCQTISYQQYGNNYLIFIDNTNWLHKEDGSLHGEGKLEVRIQSKDKPTAHLHFIYASDGNWRLASDRLLIETIKPRLTISDKTAPELRLAASNIARDVNSKPEQSVASNILFMNEHQLILEDRESHDFTRCSR
ncbi:MAG: hypothetical protein Q4A74_02820 [Cardiobacteriaceae bacterium]|nr:hypothetical protein [Cardiobacteriaceae bacterium]